MKNYLIIKINKKILNKDFFKNIKSIYFSVILNVISLMCSFKIHTVTLMIGFFSIMIAFKKYEKSILYKMNAVLWFLGIILVCANREMFWVQNIT